MDCTTAREAISATLDGEDPGVEPAALEAHLSRCPACVWWGDEAAAVSRLVRIEQATDTPDVTEEVLAGFAPPRRSGPIDWPRWALVFTAISQFSIVVSQLFLPQPMGSDGLVDPGSHMEHEAVAFNFAVGVVLLWVAARPGRARSQLPVLCSFAGVLVVLSLFDIVQGTVGWYRLVGHVPLLLGVVCTALLGGRGLRRPRPGRYGAGEPAGDVSPGPAGRPAPPRRNVA
ncbi:zf-HC2 domain-containing protein [Amycolatopsis sp.]|uniref:zf-HC2 domain-containing protein n=1 Tax=Amycolatopsis sp. TaxID=37632 RepID=UPI002D164713|nr:zf-HC2 domain-containing protein [Amycolatopsis sp.]HVV10961.1 zf-HC2 domain-containing protein [Amycolatopsis sp.]